MVKVPFAVAGATIGFPQTAARGRAWRCPGCSEPVVPHRGNTYVAHFAHKNPSQCAGESLVHRSTKEWIARQMSSPAFSITATCGTCDKSHVLFAGNRRFYGMTEVPFPRHSSPKYRIDAVAVDGERVCAAIEVRHTHAAGQDKMAALAAATSDSAFEVGAIDLIAEGYPTTFATVGPRECLACLERSRGLRATARARQFALRWRHAQQASRLLAQDTQVRGKLTQSLVSCIVVAPAGGGKTTLIKSMAAGTGKRCLLLTFSKDLANAISGPALQAKTFDSVCYGLTKLGGPLTDKNVIGAAYPNCVPWYKKKGGKDIANIAALRLQGVHVTLCPAHTAVNHGIRTAMKLPSFSASRRKVEKDGLDVAAGSAWLFIDEYQDLTQQALNIVNNASPPTVLVGDPQQAIYMFQHTLACDKCSASTPRPVLPPLPQFVLSRTFRLPQTIVDYLWARGHRLVTTNRRGGFLAAPDSALVDLLTKDTCVIARNNASVCDAAWRADAAGIRVNVVGGARIAAEILAAVKQRQVSRDPGGFTTWAKALRDPDAAADWLLAHNGDHASDFRFSTVHRAKGSEAKHVVLVGDWDWIKEPEVCYVAHTRHTATLVVCS